MSGHSKWHNIKQRKAAQDKKRGASFTKLIRGVEVGAQKGGDPSTNVSLRIAVDQAKKGGVPKDTIDRAIRRGSGEDKSGIQMQEALYEGYGPAKTALLVEVITDNPNRASAEIKHAFSKYGGSFGGSGTVKWMFERKGVVEITDDQLQGKDKDEIQLAFMDAGAQDIDENGGISAYSTSENLSKMLSSASKHNLEPAFSGLVWEAKDRLEVSDEDQVKLEKLVDALNELDDVSEVYTNV